MNIKKVLYGVIVIGLAGALYGLYLFYKAPESTHDQKTDFTLTASKLAEEYDADELMANEKYLDKILEVSGKVIEIQIEDSNPTITLETGNPLSNVTASFYPDEVPKLSNIRVGDEILIKGKCTGKLMDVVLNYCILKVNE
jgi:hypothetical protein